MCKRRAYYIYTRDQCGTQVYTLNSSKATKKKTAHTMPRRVYLIIFGLALIIATEAFLSASIAGGAL